MPVSAERSSSTASPRRTPPRASSCITPSHCGYRASAVFSPTSGSVHASPEAQVAPARVSYSAQGRLRRNREPLEPGPRPRPTVRVPGLLQRFRAAVKRPFSGRACPGHRRRTVTQNPASKAGRRLREHRRTGAGDPTRRRRPSAAGASSRGWRRPGAILNRDDDQMNATTATIITVCNNVGAETVGRRFTCGSREPLERQSHCQEGDAPASVVG